MTWQYVQVPGHLTQDVFESATEEFIETFVEGWLVRQERVTLVDVS